MERTQYNESLHRRAGIHGVERTRRFHYPWVTDALVHVIPLHQFTSGESDSLGQFEEEVRRRIAESR